MAKKIKTKRVVSKKGDEYLFSKDFGKGSTLLFKSRRSKITGEVEYKLKQKEWDEFIDKIKRNAGSRSEAIAMVADANRIKENILSGSASYKSDRQYGWNRIDENSMISRMKETQHEKFIANLGFSNKELAQYLGVSEADIADESNWGEGTFEAGGKKWAVNFNYDLTSVFMEI